MDRVEARVLERRDVTPTRWVIAIERCGLDFSAGQYVSLGVPTSDGVAERAYSIVSSPAEERLEFFLERVADGHVTPRLHAIGPGGTVMMRTVAKGRFVIDPSRTRHLMVSTSTGVAPFVSMIRSLEAGRGADRVMLLDAAETRRDLAYSGEMEERTRRAGWFAYRGRVSDEPAAAAHGALIETLEERGWDDASVYLCGSPRLIDEAVETLLRRGFSRDAIRTERFWVE